MHKRVAILNQFWSSLMMKTKNFTTTDTKQHTSLS